MPRHGTPDFGRSVNPISTRGGGANYAHQIILAPPDFQTFLQPWVVYINLARNPQRQYDTAGSDRESWANPGDMKRGKKERGKKKKEASAIGFRIRNLKTTFFL